MLTERQCSEVKTLSIITAIFQAIAQVLTYIFPLSESGHSAIFHDFAARYSNNCSELTGLIHIGMAIGLIIAFYKVFLKLIFEFISTGKEIFTKQLDIKNTSNSRKFYYFTYIPYIFMLVYLIPVGGERNIYTLLHSYSYDGNLLSEGICFIINAALLIGAFKMIQKTEKGRPLSLVSALLLALGVFFALPVSGLSLVAVVVSFCAFFSVNTKVAVRYFVSISAPVLLVKGFIEVFNCVSYVNIVAGIIGVVLAGAATFFASKFLLMVVRKNYLNYFSIYNFAIGFITLVIGIVEIIIK